MSYKDNKLIFESYVDSLSEAHKPFADFSILNTIVDQVYDLLDKKRGGSYENFQQAIDLIKTTISNSKINPESKAHMLSAVRQIEEKQNPTKLMFWIANAQQAKLGNRVIKPYGVK